MKRTILFFVIACSMLSAFGQQTNFPNVQIKTLEGLAVQTADILDADGPVILSFWATWCKPCIKELDTYNEMLIDWTEETGVKFVAVSVDNARSMSRVAPFVNGRGWDNIRFFLDPNEDFKREMNVVNVPHTFLLNEDREIVWQHTSYSEGDEYELYEQLLKLAEN